MNPFRLLAAAALAAVLPASLPAQDTAYWGGTDVDLVGPLVPPGGEGVWNTTIANWAVDPAGTSYQTWQAGDIADLGTIAANDQFDITIADDLDVGGISMILSNGGGTGFYELLAGSPQTITLTGSDPTIFINPNPGGGSAGTGTNRSLILGSNVLLAGSNGLRKTSSGQLVLNDNLVHPLSGEVTVTDGRLTLGNGNLPNVTQFNASGINAILRLNNPSSGNQDRISDTAIVELDDGGRIETALGGNRSETIGTIAFPNDLGGVQISNGGNSSTELNFTTLDRGAHGTLLFYALQNFNGKVAITGPTAPAEGTGNSIAWAANRIDAGTGNQTIRFASYNTSAGTFEVVDGTEAPTSLANWATSLNASSDAYYDLAGDLSNELTDALTADLEVRTLAYGTLSNSFGDRVADLGGFTLTARGVALASRAGGRPTLANGYITTPDGVDELYLQSIGNSNANFNVAIGDPSAPASERTNDVIFSMVEGANYSSTLDSGFIGDLFVQGRGTLLLGGSGRKVDGDVFVRDNAGLRIDNSADDAIPDTSLVTLGENTTFSFDSAADETIGGLVGTGRVVLGAGSGQTSDLRIDTGGIDRVYDGDIEGETGSGGTFQKLGAGTLTLNGDASYTANTFASSGTLLINGTHVNPTSGRDYTVENGATLGGNGSVILTNGDLTVDAASSIAPGTSIGTFSVSADVTLAGSLEIEVDGATTDLFAVTGVLDITGATLNATGIGAGATQSVYVIATHGGLVGTFATENIPAGYSVDYDYNASNQIALVSAAGDPFTTWAASNITAIDAGADASFGGNPDGDPFDNGLEWILGGDPLGFDSTADLLDPQGDATTGLTLSFTRIDESEGEATLEIDYSNDLFDTDLNPLSAVPTASGTVADVVYVIEENGAAPDDVTATIPANKASPDGKLFGRIGALD